MATSKSIDISLYTVLHYDQEITWPKTGRHILAHYDEDSVVVYQAFCPEIANYAVENGKFGGPKYNPTRMTWIKTNFLWMMYRSAWATKKNQDRILAIHLKRDGFDTILKASKEAKAVPGSNGPGQGPSGVRLQWDPDHGLNGEKKYRRAMQLGLKGKVLTLFHQEWINRIEDITGFVREQHVHVKNGDLKKVMMPRERVYVPKDIGISRHIRLDDITGKPSEPVKMNNDDSATNFAGSLMSTENNVSSKDVAGACCSELLDETTEADKINAIFEERCFSDSLNQSVSLNSSQDLIIGLGGAFNPVHTRHVQAMVETKDWLERNTRYKVVAGILALAPDGYVYQKCQKSGHKNIKSKHRLRMCELACNDYDWLQPYRKVTGSANQGLKSFKQENNLDKASIAVIVGADRAINRAGKAKWHSEKGPITICIGREGETTKIKDLFERDLENGNVGNSDFFIIPTELDNVSSSTIRDKLQHEGIDMKEKLATIMEFVDKGWLNPDIGRYIIEHDRSLYD